MAQSLAKILIHMVFSTKDRYPFLEAAIRPELHAYAATVLKSYESPALLINSVEDYAHVLCCLSKNWTASRLIGELKTATSKWIKMKGGRLTKFQWQNGYGVFSVSESQVPIVTAYIAGQEEHRRKLTFQEELQAFLKNHGVEFDERYLWD